MVGIAVDADEAIEPHGVAFRQVAVIQGAKGIVKRTVSTPWPMVTMCVFFPFGKLVC
jgi:hypothetical protein